jgi:hypothetical protein
MKIVENIRNSIVYQKQVEYLGKRNIEYKEKHGHNWIRLCTNHHDYLFYVSKQNINHIFFARVFNKDSIQQRLVSKTSKNLTNKSWYKKDITVYKDEKITTFRNTDIGTTNNVHRTERANETLGYPFRRKVNYKFMLGNKDRLQYRSECKELFSYDSNGKRKHLLDDIFCTRVYRLFLRFQGYPNNIIFSILRDDKTIKGTSVLDMLIYMYQVMSSYNPFFYEKNGISKINKEWLQHIIFKIKDNGLLDKDYKLCKSNRSKMVDSNQLKPDTKHILEWRKQQQALLDKGESWVDIEY